MGIRPPLLGPAMPPGGCLPHGGTLRACSGKQQVTLGSAVFFSSVLHRHLSKSDLLTKVVQQGAK